MLEGPESVSQTAVSSARKRWCSVCFVLHCESSFIERVINDFESLILPINNNSSERTANDTRVTPPEPNLVATGKYSCLSYDRIDHFSWFSNIRH